VTLNSVPLFPLRTVLYPDGPLPLRIFETRYLDMVSECLRSDINFGVVLIAEGQEAEGSVSTHALGTLAKIVDWDQEPDGLLGVRALGQKRFRLLSIEAQSDGLNMGRIETLPPEPAVPLPGEFAGMASLLRSVLADMTELYGHTEERYDDASWVGYRVSELLPLELEQKQLCLEIDDALERLEYLRPYLREAGQSSLD